ncbi:MAG: AEC family transporter, partial [Symploca sp. SIO2B6]|nr:AEC family transporter [Symploca sp. SIO2B6]
MMGIAPSLTQLYVPLISWISFGVILGRVLPIIIPNTLGKGLFWVGVPISIATFLRQADLSGKIWLAPAIAWFSIFLGGGLAWLWIQGHPVVAWSNPSKASFLNASTLGNTGYLGYPIVLALVDHKYFAWAVFYDTLGSTLASYGLAVILASYFGKGQCQTFHPSSLAMLLKQTTTTLI